jgi:hypothetical protein
VKRRFLVLGLLLVTGAGTARGEWKTIATATDSAPALAYDVKRTRYEPPYMTTWTRVVLATIDTLSNGKRYQSVQQKVAVDCAGHTWGVTYSEFYANRDAIGTAVYFYSLPREDWDLRPVRAGSAGARLVSALCTTPRPW